MPDDPRVQRLLDELLDTHATPEDVCGSCVELLPVVRDRWRQLCRVRADLDALFPPVAASDTGVRGRPDDTPLPTVPGYEVEAVLGCGGMGVVFRARHLRLNRVVALKTALAGAYAGPAERARFQREAEAVAALRHPNVVQVYDVGDADGRPYFTMEYVEGGSLAQKLAGTPLPPREAAVLLAALAGAVEAAHRAGVVHRDLKPANVLLAADGTPKVGDFGLARRVGGEAGLTRTGTAVGTPSYMAPEQARGAADAAGPAADVYALGAILYECVTGRPPFRADSAAETVHQLLTRDPVPPSRLNGTVPRDLETVCLTCLRKEPRQRYASAAALADDLGRFLRGDAISARPEGRLGRLARRVRRHPVFAAAVAAVTLVTAVLTSGGLWLLAERAATERGAAAAWAATERAAGDDLTDMEAWLNKSAWPEAKAAMERANGRLGDRESPRLRARLEQGGDELRLAAALDAVRMGLAVTVGGTFDYPQCDRRYEDTVRAAGLGRVHDDPAVVAGRVRASNVAPAILAALDHWSVIAADARKSWVLAVARQAERDPTGWRGRARDLAVRTNPAALAALVETAPVAEQSVSLLLAVGDYVPVNDRHKVPYLKRVQHAHPDDFWANVSLGHVLYQKDQHVEAGRYFQAALAIRPRVGIVHNSLGMALMHVPRGATPDPLAEAVEHFRLAAELDPAAAAAHLNLGRALYGMGRHAEAVPVFQRGLSLEPDTPHFNAQLGVCLEALGRHADAEAAHRHAVAHAPRDRQLQAELRAFLTRRGRPEDVRAAWQAALVADPPEHDAWYGYAEFCLYLGREDQYGHARTALLAKFGGSSHPHTAERTARAALLRPLLGNDLRAAVALADLAAAADQVTYPGAYPAFQFVHGLAAYRQGRFAQAIAAMRGDAGRLPGPAPRLVLAMALHGDGQVADARKTLASAMLSHDWRAGVVTDQDGWIRHALRREAEALLLPNLPAFLAGTHWPRDRAERDAFRGVCQFTNRTHALARLYAEGFADGPERSWDLTGHRCAAARAAAQAGCGRGADATALGEPERARWRAQARQWLRLNLAAFEKSLVTDPPARKRALQDLTQWRTDPDLATLRDAAEVEKLPAGERAECLALWDEVDALLERAR